MSRRYNNRRNSRNNNGGLGNSNTSKDEGWGLGTAFLLAGGAAAVGFMARDLWNTFTESQSASPSGSGGSGPSPPRPPPGDWERNRDNLGKRKENRSNVHDKDIPDEIKCVVCLDYPREVCVIPCGHVCLCEDCAEKVQDNCPICNRKIENKKAVYM